MFHYSLNFTLKVLRTDDENRTALFLDQQAKQFLIVQINFNAELLPGISYSLLSHAKLVNSSLFDDFLEKVVHF